MDGDAVVLVHLVELVDTHHAAVRQHHRATLQVEVSLRLTRALHTHSRVLHHARRQTRRRGALARGVHAHRRHLLHELQELRFGGGGVADDADIDVAANGAAVGSVFVDAADELEENAALDVDLGA